MNAITPPVRRHAAEAGRAILANATGDRTADLLSKTFASLGWQIAVQAGAYEVLLPEIEATDGDLLVIADLCGTDDPLQAFGTLADSCPDGAGMLVIGDRDDARLCRMLLTSGADDYLLWPVEPADLAEAVEAVLVASLPEAAAVVPASTDKARITAVTGARGGVGATGIAVNLAWTLASSHDRQTVLVDLDLGFGTAALSLDLEAGRGLEEALANPDRIDGLFLDRAMVKPSDKLAVLGGGDAEAADIYDSAGLRVLLEQLSAQTGEVVLDLPRHGKVLRDAAFGLADRVLIVSDLSIAGLRDTVRLIRKARDAGATSVDVVVNRQGAKRKGEMPLASFTRGIEMQPLAVFGEDSGLAAAMMAGVPVARQSGGRKSAVKFTRLAAEITGDGTGRSGVLRKLFGRGR